MHYIFVDNRKTFKTVLIKISLCLQVVLMGNMETTVSQPVQRTVMDFVIQIQETVCLVAQMVGLVKNVKQVKHLFVNLRRNWTHLMLFVHMHLYIIGQLCTIHHCYIFNDQQKVYYQLYNMLLFTIDFCIYKRWFTYKYFFLLSLSFSAVLIFKVMQ